MKFCNATLEFENTNNFVMCEFEKDHIGVHKGLCWSWDKMKETTHRVNQLRGFNLMLARVKRRLKTKGHI